MDTCDLCGTGEDITEAPNKTLRLCAACRADFARKECGDCTLTFSRYARGCANTMHNWLAWRP